MPGRPSIERSDARSISSSAFAPEAVSGSIASHAAGTLGNRSSPVDFNGRIGDRPEHRLRDEGERPFGADEQVPEDRKRRVEIEERVQRVAHGVLDPVLRADARNEPRIAFDTSFQLHEAASDRGLLRGERFLGAAAQPYRSRCRRGARSAATASVR